MVRGKERIFLECHLQELKILHTQKEHNYFKEPSIRKEMNLNLGHQG